MLFALVVSKDSQDTTKAERIEREKGEAYSLNTYPLGGTVAQ
jgi:hypothetical protein